MFDMGCQGEYNCNLNTEQFVTHIGEGRRSEAVAVPRPFVCSLKGSSNLTKCTCSSVDRNVAAWIRKTYDDASYLVGMIATVPARANAPKTILGSYARTSKRLMKLLGKTSSEQEQLEVLRGACLHITHSDDFPLRIADHLAGKQERRFDVRRDSKLAVA